MRLAKFGALAITTVLVFARLLQYRQRVGWRWQDHQDRHRVADERRGDRQR